MATVSEKLNVLLGNIEESFNDNFETLTDAIGALEDNQLNKEFIISTPADLIEFSNLVNSGRTHLNAKLVNNIKHINISNTIGNSQNPYSGIFDGQNYTIDYIIEGTKENSGLFGVIKNSYIKNLKVKFNITANGKYVGGLCAEANNSTIENCFINNDSYIQNDSSINMIMGGMIGKATDIKLYKCGNNSDFSNSSIYYYHTLEKFGGLIGHLLGTSKIEECYNHGKIVVDGNASGCLVGELSNDAIVTIKNCYNTGNFNDDIVKTVSGLFGKISTPNVSIENCYSAGEDLAKQYYYLGNLYIDFGESNIPTDYNNSQWKIDNNQQKNIISKSISHPDTKNANFWDGYQMLRFQQYPASHKNYDGDAYGYAGIDINIEGFGNFDVKIGYFTSNNSILTLVEFGNASQLVQFNGPLSKYETGKPENHINYITLQNVRLNQGTNTLYLKQAVSDYAGWVYFIKDIEIIPVSKESDISKRNFNKSVLKNTYYLNDTIAYDGNNAKSSIFMEHPHFCDILNEGQEEVFICANKYPCFKWEYEFPYEEYMTRGNLEIENLYWLYDTRDYQFSSARVIDYHNCTITNKVVIDGLIFINAFHDNAIKELYINTDQCINYMAFYYNWNLEKIDISHAFTTDIAFDEFAFGETRSLKTLIIREDYEILPLIDTNVFSNSGLKQIFVPYNLLKDYKAASNWSVFKNQIFSIEGDEIFSNPSEETMGSSSIINYNYYDLLEQGIISQEVFNQAKLQHKINLSIN